MFVLITLQNVRDKKDKNKIKVQIKYIIIF